MTVASDFVSPRSDLRVLVVDPSERGGIARYTQRLVAALRSEGVTTFHAAPVGSAIPASTWRSGGGDRRWTLSDV